jgi:hypothetical protein
MGFFKLNDPIFENAFFVNLIGIRNILNARAIHEHVGGAIPIGREEVITPYFIVRIEYALNLLSFSLQCK